MVTLPCCYHNVALTSLQRFWIIFKLPVGDGVKNEREKTLRSFQGRLFPFKECKCLQELC